MPASNSLAARIAAHASWAATPDRKARTAPAYAAFLKRFEDEVDPERILPEAERAIRAEHARKAHYLRLALKSANARRERKTAKTVRARRVRLVTADVSADETACESAA